MTQNAEEISANIERAKTSIQAAKDMLERNILMLLLRAIGSFLSLSSPLFADFSPFRENYPFFSVYVAQCIKN